MAAPGLIGVAAVRRQCGERAVNVPRHQHRHQRRSEARRDVGDDLRDGPFELQAKALVLSIPAAMKADQPAEVAGFGWADANIAHVA